MIADTLPCSSRQIRIAVLGMGHVGLPTSVALSEMGWHVIGADTDSRKIAQIASGEAPFYEPGLDDLLRKQLKRGSLVLTTAVNEAIRAASVVFICVGTPQAEDGRPDLTLVESLARTVASNLNGYKLIVEKSTVPAVTGQWIRKTIERELAVRRLRAHAADDGNGHAKLGVDTLGLAAEGGIPEFEVASNPEFLQEGHALKNLFNPDRIVCGVDSERAKDVLNEIYGPLGCPVVFTDLNTAELIKHTANAFLAMKISYINFVSDLCDAVGADVKQVATGIGLDHRIGAGFLNAGIGFGGYCLPKDLRALIHLAEEHNVPAALLREVENVNSSRVDRIVQKLNKALWVLPGKTIAVLGLAFKAGTDDVRHSPSLSVVSALARHGAMLRLYDPRAMQNAREIVPEVSGKITYCKDAYDAAVSADALLVLTEDDEFRRLDLERMRWLLNVPLLVDGRNVFDPELVRKYGYEYVCMGRKCERRARQRLAKLAAITQEPSTTSHERKKIATPPAVEPTAAGSDVA